MKQNFINSMIILSLGLFIGLTGCKHNPTDEVILTGITLDTAKTKTTFTVGDEFTTEGLIVTAVYSDETTKNVTGWTASGDDLSKATESQTIIISYTENEKTETATYTIVVKEKEPVKPEGTEPDDKDPEDSKDPEGSDPDNKDPGDPEAPENTPPAKLSFDITIDETSEIKLVYTIISDNKVSFEVPDEYVSYTWFVRDIMEDETSHKLTINTNEYKTGMNGILVIVKNADGTYNSASGNIYIQR